MEIVSSYLDGTSTNQRHYDYMIIIIIVPFIIIRIYKGEQYLQRRKVYMESRILLRITSILMIIMGGVALVYYLVLFDGIGLFTEGLLSKIVLTTLFIYSGYAIFMTVSGILGLVFIRRDDRMNVIRILGTIMFILQLLSFAGTLISGDNILTRIVGLLLPALYILGAKDYY